jgi:hypothetical protein
MGKARGRLELEDRRWTIASLKRLPNVVVYKGDDHEKRKETSIDLTFTLLSEDIDFDTCPAHRRLAESIFYLK